MPASADPDLLVDTSVAVAAVLADHDHHEAVVRGLGDANLGLCGHAAFETLAVLTRLPAPLRRTPQVVHTLLEDRFPASRFLPDDAQQAVLRTVSELGVAGGSVYDALVGATAVHWGYPLATRDQRALDLYRLLGVEVRLLR